MAERHSHGLPGDSADDLSAGEIHSHASDHAEPPIARDVFPEAKEYGDLTKNQYQDQFLSENGRPRYPDANDPAKPYAVFGTAHDMTQAEVMNSLDGRIIDRVGKNTGGWLAPEGTPFGARGLPGESLGDEYHAYRVHARMGLPPGWSIEESEVAPWFGQPGGGIQYRLIAPKGQRPSVEALERWGFLEEK